MLIGRPVRGVNDPVSKVTSNIPLVKFSLTLVGAEIETTGRASSTITDGSAGVAGRLYLFPVSN